METFIYITFSLIFLFGFFMIFFLPFFDVCTCAFVYLSFIFASRASYLNEKDQLIPRLFKLFTVTTTMFSVIMWNQPALSRCF